MKSADEMRAHLKSIGFERAPPFLDGSFFDDGCGEVTLETPDGTYFNASKDSLEFVQILIVGPMVQTPGQIAARVGMGYRVVGTSFLEPAEDESRQTLLDRGCISILLRAAPA